MESLDSIGRKIIWAAKILFNRGLIEVYDGNISHKISENSYVITPSRMPKSELTLEDLIIMDFNDEWSNIKGLKPSIEYRMHKLIYLSFKDVKSIIHAHNPYVVSLAEIFTDANELILKATNEVKHYIPDGISIVPDFPPGSLELARAVAKSLNGPEALVILRRHGVVATGYSVEDVLQRVLIAERNAKILMVKRILEDIVGFYK